jgi:hypothetical protein
MSRWFGHPTMKERVLNVTGASLILAGTLAHEVFLGYVGLVVVFVNLLLWFRARRTQA